MTESSASEQLLGRRFRPWWGMSPYRLIARAIVQGAIYVVVTYGSFQVRTDKFDLAEIGMQDRGDTVKRVALIVGLLACAGLTYSVIRVVVGILDLLTVGPVTGTVVDVIERRRGDVLPRIVQHMIWSRGDKIDMRPSHTQLVMDTAQGIRSWTVTNKWSGRLQPGNTVQIQASRLLGHVSKVQ